MEIIIRKMVEDDIASVADIHLQAFSRQRDSNKWITSNFRAAPRMQYYVAVYNRYIVGYIHWTQKSGFRPKVVLELEQIAVLPEMQGRGIGHRLIEESLLLVKEQLRARIRVTEHAPYQSASLYVPVYRHPRWR